MKRILIVEDTDDVRENLLEMLELRGYAVYSASDGREGLKLVYQHQPHLIICDVRMPNMDGFELLQTLRNNANGERDTPFIFISASAQKKEIEKGLAAGANAYLTKPFSMADLLTQVEQFL